MVVNLCLPHFCTTVHCNKLCADGYDVTNLVSADPALRRRGFKLEYFLRPPVQVTLKFGFQVELCRVDVELWSWGMDRGQACKRLEISTSADRPPSQNCGLGHKRVHQMEQMQVKDHNEQSREKQQERNSKSCNGRQWSLQAQQWGEQALDEPPRRDCVFKCQSNTEPGNPEPEFKLVGRCELKEETQVCFTRSNFNPRPPLLSPLPPQPANCRQEELWSRGLLSLGAVTQLRVTLPFGGAASALGLKALAVWGQPARCCPAEEVERIKRVHEASERRLQRPAFFAPSVSLTDPPLQAATSPSNLSIPEEFLDPITQEVMMLPMLLPSGVSVDNTTLEEYQKREATWGRPLNDPFTGVPFTSKSQPLPNPQLKCRIDHFLLQKGMIKRDGMLGRQGEGENPQASRLISSKVDGQSQDSACLSKTSINNTVIQSEAGNRNRERTTQIEDTGLGHSSDNGTRISHSQPPTKDNKSQLERRKKRDLSGISEESTQELTAEKQLPLTKRPRNDAFPVPGCSSHEQRLSASLDEALFSALQGRPSFTSNLSQQRWVVPDSESLNTSQHRQTAGPPSMPTGEKTCSACSCSVSAYSKSASSIYRLTCGHLLCHSCLRRESQPLHSVTMATSNHILCATCQSPTPRSDIIRVHH
ncbi:RING finger protein 37 [Micropterus salmoides]|uniref:RING finger protein 37 n=1 Tax=Micropterus salmoides TaxID=27706 RepID=UPI0018EAAD07|nr:RING finger protein 37 [Micropterus salmoides]